MKEKNNDVIENKEKRKRNPFEFFIRLKNAVINFEEYQNFAVEKVRKSIMYIVKLMIIFSIIATAIITYKFYKATDNIILEFKNKAPEFSFENNVLKLENSEEFKIVDETNSLSIIVNTKEDLAQTENIEYAKSIIFLKDKMIINYSNQSQTMTYEQMAQNYDLTNINKEKAIEYFNSNNMLKIYALFFAITYIYAIITYLIVTFVDILLLSILGFLIGKLFKVNFKYKQIFNISAHAMTLSILLYIIYTIVNLTTGYTIKYFGIAYDAISYIYLITAILIIKSETIKRKVEVMKIVEEQEKIKQAKNLEEETEEEKPEIKQKEENTKKKDKKSTKERTTRRK